MKFCFSNEVIKRASGFICLMIISICLVLASTPVLSQNEKWVVFNTTNSDLPDNHVLSLAIDSYNNKWIGTKFSGLVKFDGKDWKIFMPDSAILFPPLLKKEPEKRFTSENHAEKTFYSKTAMTLGPQFNAFYDLAIDANDTKWIGSKIGGLIRFDGTEWKVFNQANSGMPDDYAWSVALEANGAKWIGTKKGGVVKFDGKNWTVFDKNNSGLPDNDVCSIAIEKKGNIWIGTSNGLAKFDGKNWTVYHTGNSGLPANAVWALAIDAKKNIWVGTQGGGMAKFDGTRWNAYNKSNSGLPENEIASLAIDDANNTIWIGTTNAGLAKFDGMRWTVFDTQNSALPQNNIKDLLIDNLGNKWIGTEMGLAIYREEGVLLTRSTEDFTLSHNYPNPFNAMTEFYFDIPRRTWVNVSIYNILGQLLQTLINEEYYPGRYYEQWDGLTQHGTPAPAGLYLYRVKTDFGARSRKMMLIR